LTSQNSIQSTALIFQARILDFLQVGVEVVFLFFDEIGLAYGVALLLEDAVELDSLLPLLLLRLRHRGQVILRLGHPIIIRPCLLKLSIALWNGTIDTKSILHLLLGR